MAKTNEIPNCNIGDGSVFEGRFVVAGSIHIDGKFQGEIQTNDHLLIGPTGKVKTNITAKRVTVAGVLIGNITAAEEVELLASGMVLGNIRTPRLKVEEGVITEGEVIITGEKKDDIKKTILESFGKESEDEMKSVAKSKRPSALEKMKEA